MANKMYSYYKELPSWAKGVVVIGGIAIVYFTSKQLIARIKGQSEAKKMRESIITQENELKNKLDTGLRLSYPNSQYQSWANQIANEFAGCDPLNASFGKFVNILGALKNDADFLKLSTSFDIKTYDQCGLWNGDFKGTLAEAVNDEFNNNDLLKINKLLRDRKITYQF